MKKISLLVFYLSYFSDLSWKNTKPSWKTSLYFHIRG